MSEPFFPIVFIPNNTREMTGFHACNGDSYEDSWVPDVIAVSGPIKEWQVPGKIEGSISYIPTPYHRAISLIEIKPRVDGLMTMILMTHLLFDLIFCISNVRRSAHHDCRYVVVLSGLASEHRADNRRAPRTPGCMSIFPICLVYARPPVILHEGRDISRIRRGFLLYRRVYER